MDPSQHSSILFSCLVWTGLFALADGAFSWLGTRDPGAAPTRCHPLWPALRVGVRAGLCFGLIALLGTLGLAVSYAVPFGVAAFFVTTTLVSDRLVPALKGRRVPGLPDAELNVEPPSVRPPAALSVVASRAKRLEYVPASILMVPRKSIVGCDSAATVEEAAALMRETGLSRIIAYSKNIDRPLGLAHIKDVLPKIYGRGGATTVESLLRPLVLVPSSMRALDLLRDFQRLKRRVGIVRDLQGERTLGLVSTEDILEELVGEIQDEHEGPLLSALASGVALVRADLKVEDLLEGIGVPMEGIERDQTVGELVRSLLGKEAEPGDAVFFKDLRLTVEEIVDGEIWMLRVERAGA